MYIIFYDNSTSSSSSSSRMSGTSLYNNNAIEQILECPICMDTFVKPKVLPCQHSFCLECIHRSYTDNVILSEKYKLTCPICREIYQLKAPKSYRSLRREDLDCRLQNHFVLNALLDAKQKALENNEKNIKKDSPISRNNNNSRKASVKRNFSVHIKQKSRTLFVTLKCATCRLDRKWQCVTCDAGFCHECVVDHFDTKPDHEIFDLESQILCESNELAKTSATTSTTTNPTTKEPNVSAISSSSGGIQSTVNSQQSTVVDNRQQQLTLINNSQQSTTRFDRQQSTTINNTVNTIVDGVVFSTTVDSPSWADHAKQLVRSSYCITKAAVVDASNGDLWSHYSRDFHQPFAASCDELKAVCDHFRATSQLFTEGVTLEKFKYVVTLCEKNIIFGKLNSAGVFALKTERTILIVLFNGDICESAAARDSIERAAAYLKNINY